MKVVFSMVAQILRIKDERTTALLSDRLDVLKDLKQRPE
jgi:hypothetical protein